MALEYCTLLKIIYVQQFWYHIKAIYNFIYAVITNYIVTLLRFGDIVDISRRNPVIPYSSLFHPEFPYRVIHSTYSRSLVLFCQTIAMTLRNFSYN